MKVRSLVRVALAASLLAGCNKGASSSNPELSEAASEPDLWSLYEALEKMVDAERASESDREYAYAQAQQAKDDGTAQWAFARAAITGRLAEAKGLKALWLIKEVETYAMLSIERDPAFNDSAAKRMLGTLYVLAGDHVEHGDSEKGLEILEGLLDAQPDHVRNQLRVAQGYISLGDPDPALEILCQVDQQRDGLSPDEQRLLDRLFEDVGGASVAGCG